MRASRLVRQYRDGYSTIKVDYFGERFYYQTIHL